MKRIIGIFVSFFMIVNICACGKHRHTWKEATCILPKHCTGCWETEGEAMGHSWEEATCERPKTCTRCGETEGEAAGHQVEEWSQKSISTCAENGIESGICSVCGETVERKMPLLEHIPGEWEVVNTPTENSNGLRKKVCIVCGATLEKEEFSLTDKELKELYISKCKKISYENLCRTPDKYKGEYVKYSGYVVQICSEATSSYEYSAYRVTTSGRYDNIAYIIVDNYGAESRILEDDYITFYGTYDGLFTYETVRGDELTIPKIKVAYID